MNCRDLISCPDCKYVSVCPCKDCMWAYGYCAEICPDAFEIKQQYDLDNRPETKMDVTIVISLQLSGKNSNDDKIKDILRHFNHHNEFQINQTYAKINRTYVDKITTHGE